MISGDKIFTVCKSEKITEPLVIVFKKIFLGFPAGLG